MRGKIKSPRCAFHLIIAVRIYKVSQKWNEPYLHFIIVRPIFLNTSVFNILFELTSLLSNHCVSRWRKEPQICFQKQLKIFSQCVLLKISVFQQHSQVLFFFLLNGLKVLIHHPFSLILHFRLTNRYFIFLDWRLYRQRCGQKSNQVVFYSDDNFYAPFISKKDSYLCRIRLLKKNKYLVNKEIPGSQKGKKNSDPVKNTCNPSSANLMPQEDWQFFNLPYLRRLF